MKQQEQACPLQLEDLPAFLRVEEVAKILQVSESRAYKIMRELNKELERKGKITTAGRVSSKYLLERVYY
ncbi:MAG: transcriptional regulator [Oscillospiraceae bacterium]|jgi:predicted transcriptional regulator|nr:transcriptional regulator [Oscillospiraceae bacterium]